MSRASNLAGFTTSISPPANLSVGIITASSVINVGTGLTLSSSGINITGVITATSFSGNGSGLIGVSAGIGTTGSVNTSGIITASSFSGDGSGLTGVAATTLTIGAGTTALPSISPTGDSNTGIFFPSADTIAFSEGGAEAMRVDSSGRLLVGTSSGNANGGILQLTSGITFPATAVAASDANTLDDYEEGTWTPTAANFTLGGSSTLTGTYTKIGRVIYFSVTFVNTGTIAYSVSAFISLPFAGVDRSGMVAMSLESAAESQTSGKNGVQNVIDVSSARFFVGSFTTTTAGQQLNFAGFYRVS
jgi:hypothetical protein